MFHPIVIFALIFFIALNIFFLLWDIARFIVGSAKYELPFLPNEMRQASRMNWAGCIITSILMFVILPIPYILRALVFLFHV